MKTIAAITLIIAAVACLAPPARAQTAPDTCWVEGQLWTNEMRPAARAKIEVRRIVKSGYIYVFGVGKHEADSSGFIRFPVPQGSRVWLYADLPGLKTASPDGIEKTIPSTPTARLETLPTPATQATQVLVVPPQRYRVQENGVTKADTIHTLDVEGAGVTVTNPSSGTARISITGGSSAAYGDSIRVADSLARAALDSVRDARLRLLAVEALAQTAMDSASRARLDAIAALALAGLARDTAALATLRALAALALAQTALDTASRARLDLIATTAIASAARDTASLATLRALVAQSMASSALSAAATALDSASRARLDLASHISTADAHLPSQTTHTGKFLQTNGTVTSWQPEADPTVLSKASSAIDSATTVGARSIASSGRMYVSDDSITFTVSPSDVVNAALGNVFRGTLGRNDTLSISNMVDGQIISVIVTNGGTYTLAWSGINWAGGTAPTLSAVANKRDVFTFIRSGGIVYGSVVQDLR